MSEDLTPSPPPPNPSQEGLEGAEIEIRRYTCNKWRTWLECGETTVPARRVERFSTVSVVPGIWHNSDPNEPNRRTYEWPHGPRQARWQLWGWDKFTNLLILLDYNQVDLGGAVAASKRLGVPIVVSAWDYSDHRSYFEDVAVPLRSVRVPVSELRRQRWAIEYLTDGVVWISADSEPGALVVTKGALQPAEPTAPDIRNPFLDAMLLAIADTESRWTNRADVYLTNPEPEEEDIPRVATCPPWWQRLLIHWALGWPGRVAMWYLTFWYVPNLFWSAVIFTPFIQWGIRIHRRLKWQKINRKLFEARTQIMVAQAELSGRMSLYQLMAADLPGDEAKAHRSKLLAEQNALALASQSLGIVERNFYVRHPIYARKHSALFH